MSPQWVGRDPSKLGTATPQPPAAGSPWALLQHSASGTASWASPTLVASNIKHIWDSCCGLLISWGSIAAPGLRGAPTTQTKSGGEVIELMDNERLQRNAKTKPGSSSNTFLLGERNKTPKKTNKEHSDKGKGPGLCRRHPDQLLPSSSACWLAPMSLAASLMWRSSTRWPSAKSAA